MRALRALRALILACVTMNAPAWADDVGDAIPGVPIHELRPAAGIEAPDTPPPEYLRPLDASDTEMQALMQRFFELTPYGPAVRQGGRWG